MHHAEFETTILTSERPQTHAFESHKPKNQATSMAKKYSIPKYDVFKKLN
jgi:hypothetical protein